MKKGSLRKTQIKRFCIKLGIESACTKEFNLFGTITNLRLADDGAVVSYGIATDKGYNTTRHWRFLRPLAAEHDPKITKQNNKERNVSKPSSLGKIEITTDLDVLTDDDSADLTEQYVEKPRRSSRIKQKSDIIRTIWTRVKRVRNIVNHSITFTWFYWYQHGRKLLFTIVGMQG